MDWIHIKSFHVSILIDEFLLILAKKAEKNPSIIGNIY